MSGLVTRFAYDPTGTNPDNLIANEPHVLSNNAVRAFAPIYGPFYTSSARVYDGATHQLLERGTQYEFVELIKEISLKTGKEICCVVLILDRNVSGNVLFTYNCVGGLYQNETTQAIVNLYETVAADNRPVAWSNVLNKPLQFPPTDHLHVLRDINGFEPVVVMLERIRNALMLSDVPIYEAMVDYFNKLVADLQTMVQADKAAVDDLLARMAALQNALEAEIITRGDADSVFAAEIASLLAQLAAEINNRTLTDTALSADISALTTGLQAEINNRTTADTAEAAARTTAINSEATTRAANDTTETNARIAGDANLQTQINNIGNTLITSYVRLDGTNVMTGPLRNSFAWNGLDGGFELLQSNAYVKWGSVKGTNTTNDLIFGASSAGVFNWYWYSGTGYNSLASLDHLGNFIATGDIGMSSDQRLKTDWKRIENALSKIKAIEGGTFRRIATGEVSVGVIAQAVRAVIPEAVKTDENGYLSVAYGNLVGLLIEGIKELSDTVAEQAVEIQALKNQTTKY